MKKSGVEPCCPKIRRAWGRFIDHGRNGRPNKHLVIFAKEVSPNQITQKQRTFEIKYCPFCGKKLKFLDPVEVSRV